MATAFETGTDAAETAITGYVAEWTPKAVAIGIAFLGLKYLVRFIRRA